MSLGCDELKAMLAAKIELESCDEVCSECDCTRRFTLLGVGGSYEARICQAGRAGTCEPSARAHDVTRCLQ